MKPTVGYKRIIIVFITFLSCAFLHAQEKGTASYYSNRLHGRRMSDGTKYHKDSLTCAHKRYPLGSMLKVTNLKNGKSVIVKVTDRCGSRRIIDLSYAAAKEIDIIRSGVAMVKVEKYNDRKGVPYKDEEKNELPELDYEITNKNDDYTPEWVKKDTEKKEEKKKNIKETDKDKKKK